MKIIYNVEFFDFENFSLFMLFKSQVSGSEETDGSVTEELVLQV